MAMDGGAMGGYWEMGRLWMASPPATIIMMAITQAKTGRSRKKFDNIRGLRYSAAVVGLFWLLLSGRPWGSARE